MVEGSLFVVSSDLVQAEQIAKPLRDRGWSVSTESGDHAGACWRIGQELPAAVIISLDFDPDAACTLACALSIASATRDIPVVFVGGTSDDIEAAIKVAPHARFVTPSQLAWEVKRISLRQ